MLIKWNNITGEEGVIKMISGGGGGIKNVKRLGYTGRRDKPSPCIILSHLEGNGH